jgi:tetratricopeptide (TPR) repeat protein
MKSFDLELPRAILRIFALLLLLSTVACGGGQKAAEWPPVAKKWFDRATHSYQNGDIEDARLASENALSALPDEPEVRLVAAEIAMAELEFDRALQLLRDMPSSEAAGLRGRCHWYLGNIEQAAEELAAVSSDPDVKDAWADETLRLARSGRGRRPFEMTGGIVAAVDMPWAGSAMLVPIEVNGGLPLSTAFSFNVSWARETETPAFTRAAACFRLAGVIRLIAPS